MPRHFGLGNSGDAPPNEDNESVRGFRFRSADKPSRLQKPCKVRARRWPVTVQYGENLHDGQRPVLSSVLTEFERTDQLEGA